jgi:hypothetical protein
MTKSAARENSGWASQGGLAAKMILVIRQNWSGYPALFSPKCHSLPL